MTPTVVFGVERTLGLPYEAILKGPCLPVLLPVELRTTMPLRGTPVMSGPAGIEIVFDPEDPATVYAWLLGDTDVIEITGPALLDVLPGDLLHDAE